MPTPILTSTTTTGDVSTFKADGESTRDWVAGHTTALLDRRPSGNRLTTTWNSSSGMQSKSTDRLPGESDEIFMLRHVNDYTTMMAEYPPTP